MVQWRALVMFLLLLGAMFWYLHNRRAAAAVHVAASDSIYSFVVTDINSRSVSLRSFANQVSIPHTTMTVVVTHSEDEVAAVLLPLAARSLVMLVNDEDEQEDEDDDDDRGSDWSMSYCN